MARLLYCLLLPVIAGLGWLGGDASERQHVVAPGESLSAIAERYGVDVHELREWNALEHDTIRVGQTLEIERPSRGGEIVHRVQSGETLSRIARRYAVTVAHLLARNPEIAPDRVREGEEIVIGSNEPSESVGEPGAGSIRGALQLGTHRGYVLRNPERAYATRRTVERLVSGFDALLRSHPGAPRVRVHDLSLRAGGPIDDHHTHQSGRDVDITYFQRRGCTANEGCPLRPVAPDELDAERQWRLLHHWIARREVEVVYVDRSLQAVLYHEAQRAGATRAELEQWFQYPRGASAPVGLIRHYPNHVDHVHVRFACAPGEHRCSRATQGP